MTKYFFLLVLMALSILGCQKPQPEMLQLSCTPVLYKMEDLHDTLVGSRWLLDQVVVNGEIQVPEYRVPTLGMGICRYGRDLL